MLFRAVFYPESKRHSLDPRMGLQPAHFYLDELKWTHSQQAGNSGMNLWLKFTCWKWSWHRECRFQWVAVYQQDVTCWQGCSDPAVGVLRLLWLLTGDYLNPGQLHRQRWTTCAITTQPCYWGSMELEALGLKKRQAIGTVLCSPKWGANAFFSFKLSTEK